ncbi:MAG: aromatic amino acid hydroxylase [Proteobacteria bacterium]|nr:aromatic amino acid hydroxylase [Pseudomonadota bacterium]
MTQQEIIASLPTHLKPFVGVQDYGQYTPRDHAVWRFLLKHLSDHLQATAHPVYLEGLARTGISLDHIPSIDEMNSCLAQLGWRAVVVDGFVPPAIFMEFQALKILVIALDMRSVDHIEYTPAPDIVHESAGHAPFIVDVDYAEFLQRFGEVGMKAVSNEQDQAVYEAIRQLSIVKECPDSTSKDIAVAEGELRRANEANVDLSEASLLSRLHWWTVEYGLVGEVDDYKIFGAGLLSSLGESKHCLDDDQVQKVPLTVDAVTCPYDITSVQPRLFVTKSCRHLSQVLEEFAATMCFKRGGAESLNKAVQAATICTAQYDSGMQVSGVFDEILCDAVGNPIYLRTRGPSQLAWRGSEIYGHGTATHPQGFGSPIGLLKDFSRCLSQYTIDELRAHDIAIGQHCRLEFLSGITVVGELRRIHRQEHRSLILGFEDCTVTDMAGRVLFDPAWGCYDMAVGASIDSVFGGAADREQLQLYPVSPAASNLSATDKAESQLMALYSQVSEMRNNMDEQDIPKLMVELGNYPDEWLLRVEFLNALLDSQVETRSTLERELREIQSREPAVAKLIDMAIH